MDELLLSRGAWRCLVTHPGPVRFDVLIWETGMPHLPFMGLEFRARQPRFLLQQTSKGEF